MIDGLKLTLTGEELRRMLGDRAEEHRASSAHWTRESTRDVNEQTIDDPVLPAHMCENEAERHEWRADVLEFLRDHLEPLEVYRLGASDLEFGELLPSRPGWVEQDEYEQQNRVGFALERLGKRVCLSPEIIHFTNPDYRAAERHDDERSVARNEDTA